MTTLYWKLIAIAVIITGVSIGIIYWHHKTLEEGIAKQIAADNVATLKVQQQAAAETAVLQAQANTAETAHAQEIASLTAQLNTPIQPIRLCSTSHAGGSGLPQTGTANVQHASTGAPAGPVQPVPEGNSSGGGGTAGPDISSLLQLFALQADTVSAQLREYQSR
jgi:hypothetical protein